MTDNEITTEDLLNMRVVPEQQADLAAVMDAFGLAPSLEGLTAEEQVANLTRQRDAWRHDALTAEQRIDALNERLADRDAQLDQAKTAHARALVRYSQDEMFLRLMGAEADRDAAEAALAQLTGITPLPAAPVGGQAEPTDALDTRKLRLLVEPHPNQWAVIQLHDAALAAADEIDRLRAAAAVSGEQAQRVQVEAQLLESEADRSTKPASGEQAQPGEVSPGAFVTYERDEAQPDGEAR